MSTQIRVFVVAAVTLPILAATSTSAFGQNVTLQYRWTKGEETRYRFVQQSTATVAGLPGLTSSVIETNMSEVVRTAVDDVAADGAATLRYVYESARWETRTPMGTTVVDTTSTDPTGTGVPNGIKDVLAAMVGETFVAVVAPTGQVQKVDGLDRIVEKMFKSIPTDPSTAAMIETLKSSFNAEWMQNTLTQGSAQFPDRPLTPGDTWDKSATATNPLVGRQTTTTQFTLKDVETSSGSRVARIAMRVTTQPPEEPTGGLAGLKMRLTDDSGEGDLVFDVTNGRLLRSTTHVTMSFDMSAPAPDGTAMNMSGKVTTSMSAELLQPTN